MILTLFHGRFSPDAELNDWGFDGPVLDGVKSVHHTYIKHIRVIFEDEVSFEKARQETGWDVADHLILEMHIIDDLIEARAKYYGDWSLQAGPAVDELSDQLESATRFINAVGVELERIKADLTKN